MMRTFKRFLFFCLFIGLCLVILFYQSLLSSIAAWSLETYAMSKWGSPFHYEKVYFKGAQLVVLRPQLETDYSFSAEEMTLTFHFNWWKRLLHVAIALDQPHWHFYTPLSSEKTNWRKFLDREEKWMKTQSSFQIQKGVFTWTCDNQSHQLGFDLEASRQEGGWMKVFLDVEDPSSNYLLLHILNRTHQIEMMCECHEVNAPSLMSLTQFLNVSVSPWLMTSGTIQGKLKAILMDKQRPYLEGELLFKQLGFTQTEANIQGQVKQARLKMGRDPTVYDEEKGVSPVIGQFEIFQPASFSYSTEQHEWNFDHIVGSIRINTLDTALLALDAQGGDSQHRAHWNLRGTAHLDAHHSLDLVLVLMMQLADLKGEVNIEWGNHQKLLNLTLDGKVEDLVDFLPAALQERLHQDVYHHRLRMLADIKKIDHLFEMAGRCHLQGADQENMIHFGGELRPSGKGTPMAYIPYGWFYAHHLPLDQFLFPLIFSKKGLCIRGEAEVKGTFDDQELTLQYNVEGLGIENDQLAIEVKHLSSESPGEFLGFHRMDLKTYAHQGVLPIQHGSYVLKNGGLMFQEIQGVVTFKDQVITLSPLEAYCEGIYFAGQLEFDYSDPAPDVFNLAIQCPLLSGRVSQVQHLLTHFSDSSPVSKIPLEGDLSARGEGLKLHFAFMPEDYQLQAELQGMIGDGSFSWENMDMALKGIDMDIHYEHSQQLLEFTDIQGTLLVGKPRRVEEYLFKGDYLRFHQLAHPEVSLDLAVMDRDKELLRVVGYSQEEEEGIQSLHLNPELSHVSEIYPQQWQCRLKEWAGIERLEFQSEFNLGGLLQDVQRFRCTGLLFLSPHLIDRLSPFLPLEGQGSITLHYHPAEQLYFYQFEGKQLKLWGDFFEHQGFLKGRKQDKKWIIDHLQWDDWSLYAELQQTLEGWRIPFLGLRAEEALLLGLEGNFITDQELLQAKINLCEVNLGVLSRWKVFQSWMAKWQPEGHLKMVGEMEWSPLSAVFLEGLKVKGQAEVQGLAVRNYAMQVLSPFQIKFDWGQGLSLQNLQLEFPPRGNEGHVQIQSLNYQLIQDHLACSGLAFRFPSSSLEALSQELDRHFPEILDVSFKEILTAAKPEGELEGVLAFDSCSNRSSFRLKLRDGLYRFKKRDYDLRQFEIEAVGDKLHFSAVSQQERYPFKILGEADWPSFRQGYCQLIGVEVSAKPFLYRPLMMHWENHPMKGVVIRSLQGDFAGCSLRLVADPSSDQKGDWRALQGQVTIDFNLLSPLLSSSVAETIQKLRVGSSYLLKGRFWVNPDLGRTLLEITSFQGHLTSQEAILKGYQMRDLQAQLQYVPGRLDIQNLRMEDRAGSVQVEDLIVALDSKTGHWSVFMPHLLVKNLRLSLLRDIDFHEVLVGGKFRSLMIKRLELRNFCGELNRVQTWRAQGSFHFLNPLRRNFSHPLLAIPAEIILRLGLNPQVLNPVTGMIYFDLKGDRFYFTRFKDVYSEGRGSKFYLAGGPTPSWMDFDGRLFVQIRMKQYNLIFKLAELFTVSVQGDLKNPRYTLRKQSKTSHKAFLRL